MNIIDRLLINEDDRERIRIADELSEMGERGVDLLLDSLKSNRDLRVLLITLSRVISKEKNRKHLIYNYKRLGFRPLIEYSKSDDAKVRKNAYIIMGEICDDKVVSALMNALTSEETYFNIPSILLAIGNVGQSSHIDKITNRVEELLLEEISDKHKKEIIKAKDKCIDKLRGPRDKHKFIGFNKATRIILTTMQEKEKILLEEARKYYPKAKLSRRAVEITTDDYNSLENIRTYSECFIAPLKLDNMPLDMDVVSKILKENLSYDLIDGMHQGQGEYRYRLEIIGADDKTKMIDDLIYAINDIYDNKFQNSASNYEIELRFIIQKDKCRCFCKLYTTEDKRFDYRINDIPASIKGDNAAIIMRLIKHHLQDNANVLDPFMGTGTMLIERCFYGNTSSLTGVDISKGTIDKARENFQRAGIRANLINKDIIRLSGDIRYDEIISNMPYGLRVGTHKHNEKLYKAFVDKIPMLLKPQGKAILLTADYNLLKQVARSVNLRLVDEHVINNGGLYPRLLVYKLI